MAAIQPDPVSSPEPSDPPNGSSSGPVLSDFWLLVLLPAPPAIAVAIFFVGRAAERFILRLPDAIWVLNILMVGPIPWVAAVAAAATISLLITERFSRYDGGVGPKIIGTIVFTGEVIATLIAWMYVAGAFLRSWK